LSVCIGIEGSSLVGPRTGVGYATASLLDAMSAELPSDWELRVWVNSPRHPLPDDGWRSHPQVRTVHTRWPGKLLLHAWRHLGYPPAETMTGPISLFHSPAGYVVPSRGTPRILSVHDLYFRGRPVTEDPYGGGYFARTYGSGLKGHDRLICFTESVAEELAGAYRIPRERISVIPHGVDQRDFNVAPEQSDAALVHAMIGPEPYLLAVGTIGERKNLKGLVEAYAILVRELGDLPRLVLAGHMRGGPGLGMLDAQIRAAGLDGRIVRTGYVSRAQIAALYRQAVAFVMPSLHEGFGLPILEAMACGCPVVCSGEGALGEVSGDAAMHSSVGDAKCLASSIRQLLLQPSERARLREIGLQRAQRFTWKRAAEATIAVYREVLAGA
jgi:glycosyltransferase involved in cell wall biosynthesis